MGVLEFWDLTFGETRMAIEAGAWRLEQEHRGRVWLAWHTAALSRARTLPSLTGLLNPAPSRALRGDELARRRAEHEELIGRMNAAALQKGNPQPSRPAGEGRRKRRS